VYVKAFLPECQQRKAYLYGRLRHCRQLVGAEVDVGQVLVDDPVRPRHITVVLWRVFARQEILHLSLVPETNKKNT
jgi:hypothetical protein